MAALVAGLGYMGAALASALLTRGEQVVALDNRFSTDDGAIAQLVASGVQFVEGDIAEPPDVNVAFEQAAIDTVYLFAAQASAHPEAASAGYTEWANLRGPRVVLDGMRERGVRTLVYASSFKVYSEPLSGTIDESRPYGQFRDLAHLSKVHVEKLMEMYAGLYGLRCLSLRYGIVHGLGPVFKRDPRFVTVPNRFCWQAAQGEPLSVFGGGRTAAGFIHVADAASAAISAAGNDGFQGYVVLHAVGEVASVAEVAALVREAGAARGLAVTIEGLDPAGLIERSTQFTVTSRLDALLPAWPRQTLRESIPDVLDYCLAATRETSHAASG